MTITLATLPQATEQQVFDQVKAHLLNQYNKSMSSIAGDNMCVYRNPHGLSCAAGCLISDQEYDPGMEGNGWPSLIDQGTAPTIHEDLITALQTVHDENLPMNWVRALNDVATDFGLTY